MEETFRDLESNRDVEEILVLALQTTEDGRTLQDRLRESARELGISDSALEQAARRWRGERDRRDFSEWFRLKKRHDFVETLIDLFTGAGVCLVVDYLVFGRFTWSLIVAGILGVVFLARVMQAVLGAPSDADFDRWRRRRDERASDGSS